MVMLPNTRSLTHYQHIMNHIPKMASSFQCFLLLLHIILLPSAIAQTTSFRPKALVLRVTKDDSTNQYLTHITQRTPPVAVKVAIDLGGEFLWVNCEQGYNSSTYKPVPCRSAQCNLSGTNACSTNGDSSSSNDICAESPHNPLISTSTIGDFAQDIIHIQSTNGKNPGPTVTIPKLLFTCGPTFLLQGLPSGAVGFAGLGRNKVALPSLFSAAFSFPRKFAVCLSSTTRSNGVVLFGNGPYVLLPKNDDVSQSLTYTPLIRNPRSLIGSPPSAEYFIGVESIKINGKPVALNTSLLTIDHKDGFGGTKISTVHPYTVLETSIYNAVVEAFVKALGNVPRVAALAPFGACFSSRNIGSTGTGPAVPPIDLVLQNDNVFWRIYGANSMVEVSDEVSCLGVVDGGELHFVDWGIKFATTAIVIGGHQIEDNLLQFDLAASRLGFSSSLLLRQTSCSNFNFTSTA